MHILGIHDGHDSCAAIYDDYRLLAAVPLERMTREKSDGHRFPEQAVSEILSQTGIERETIGAVAMGRDSAFWARDGYLRLRSFWENPAMHLRLFRARLRRRDEKNLIWFAQQGRRSAESFFDADRFYQEHGFPQKPRLFFFNHHYAHALGALFHTDWKDALIYTADGCGDDVYYSHRVFKNGALKEFWGGEEDTLQRTQHAGGSVGQLYAMTTHYLGFKPLRHEGKVLGLAAYGKPAYAKSWSRHFRVCEDGRIVGRRRSRVVLRNSIRIRAKRARREDVAASVQKSLETLVLEAVGKLLERHKVRHLALAGGVFANVRLNQRLAEELPVEEIFIYPAMSDQGLAAGGVLQYLLERDGLETWLKKRERFRHLYLGRDYDAEAEAEMQRAGAKPVPHDPLSLEEKIAALLDEGKIIGLYAGRMEYGPRALGARSILAAPTDPHVNDWLNERLSRTEFMPFAPVVRAERAEEIFQLRPSMLYAARFMTITCAVKPAWRAKIPAVVHVDGTARPQLITRGENPFYYDILQSYEKRAGLPVLINTSFNAHEEPIINTPREAAQALMQGRVDYVATRRALWEARGDSEP